MVSGCVVLWFFFKSQVKKSGFYIAYKKHRYINQHCEFTSYMAAEFFVTFTLMHLNSHLTKRCISQCSSLLNITELWEPNLTVCFKEEYSQLFFTTLPFQTSDDLLKRCFKTLLSACPQTELVAWRVENFIFYRCTTLYPKDVRSD